MRSRAARPSSSSKKLGPARGTGTTIYFRPDAEIFGDKLKFDAELDPRAPRGEGYLHAGLEHRLRRTRRRARRSTSRTRTASPTTSTRSWPSAATPADPRRRLRAVKDERRRARGRAPVDRGHRRAHSLLRQRHPDRLRRHARGGLQARRRARRCATSSRRTKLTPKGVDAHRRGHPRGRRRRAQRLHRSSRSSRARRRSA